MITEVIIGEEADGCAEGTILWIEEDCFEICNFFIQFRNANGPVILFPKECLEKSEWKNEMEAVILGKLQKLFPAE